MRNFIIHNNKKLSNKKTNRFWILYFLILGDFNIKSNIKNAINYSNFLRNKK